MAGYSVTFSVVDQATAKIDEITRRIRQMREPLERQTRSMQRFVDATGLNRMAEGFQALARGGAEAFSSLSRLIPVIGGITGAAVAAGLGLNKLAEGWSNWATPLTRNADLIGTTAQQLDVLQRATVLAGGSADDMTESLKGITDQAARAFIGLDPQALAWFNRLRIDLHGAHGELRKTTDLLPELVAKLGATEEPVERTTAALALGGPKLLALVEDFRLARREGESVADTFKRISDESARRGPMFSPADAETLRRYHEALGQVSDDFDRMERSAGVFAAKVITPILEGLHGMIALTGDLTKALWEPWRVLGQNLSAWWDSIAPIRKWIEDKWSWLAGVGQGGTAAAPTAPPGQTYVPGYGNVPAPARRPEVFGPPIPPGLGSAGPQPAPTVNIPGYGNVPNVPGPMRPGPATPMSGDHAEFIRRAWPLALEAGKRTGVDPKIVLAQAALESNWGKSAPGNNYFGIKGPGGTYATQEFENGRFVTKDQSFAGYGSIEESFKGYADFINRNQRYASLKSAQGVDAQIAALQASGYATDPAYGAKIAAIAKGLPAPAPTALAQATPPVIDLGQYRSGLAAPVGAPKATGEPAQVTGGAPVTGSVDVTITHKNPPPGATLAATGTGDVNVAPPRTERQQLNAA